MKTFIASLILLCAVATFIAFNTAYIVRISDEMLEIAKERFKGCSNVNYEVLDYSKELPA